MWQNYLWDFDGTLYDSYPMMTEVAFATAQEFGLTLTPKELYYWMKKESLRYIAQEFAQERSAEFLARFHQLEAPHLADPRPFPEVPAVLQALTNKGARHFIVTHRDRSAFDMLERDGLAKLITDGTTADDHFPAKPDPASLRYLVEKYQLVPEQTVMVGDRLLDVLAGKRAGLATCLYEKDDFLGAIPADRIVEDLRQLL